ncbi:MAG: DUF1646 family protein [Thermoplasmata archaeon]|nr:DUF1646 family protein [Thermoplasmata archaeon]
MKLFKDNMLLFSLLLSLLLLTVLYPANIPKYPSFIDWNTLILLSGLLLVTTGMKESRYFDILSEKLLKKLKNERAIALLLIFISSLLSTFLTNDVALFIVIPFTLSFRRFGIDTLKLLVFETIAVNVGSCLTPIGNPQNLFIWQKWHIPFFNFILSMLPLFLILLSLLIILSFLSFSSKMFIVSEEHNEYDGKLFTFSFLLLISFIIFAEIGYSLIFLLMILSLYSIFYRNVIKRVDWLFLLIFLLMFILFGSLSNVPVINEAITPIKMTPKNVFVVSSLFSQFMSNVPAAIFLSNFTSNWKALAYGVNVGGNGIIFASLANIITFRIAKDKKLWKIFHLYSIPFFIFSFFLVYLILS